MKLYIKNMVCSRCKFVVKTELENKGLHPHFRSAGEVEIDENIPAGLLEELMVSFRRLGLEMIDDKESIIIDKIKNSIHEIVYGSEEISKTNLSEYIVSKLGYSYNYLSTLFSSVHGSSIEKYFIRHKVDRIKEILIHENLSFSEIAFKMNYSSLAHLSGQFKKETGLTLSQFRQLSNLKGN